MPDGFSVFFRFLLCLRSLRLPPLAADASNEHKHISAAAEDRGVTLLWRVYEQRLYALIRGVIRRFLSDLVPD